MVCTVKQKLCATCNRTELSDYQLVVIDGIMIENIVLFKVPWIVHKVVVKSKVSDFDVRVCDYVFQIHYRIVPFTGIYFFAIRNSHRIHLLLFYYFKTIPAYPMQSFTEFSSSFSLLMY